MKIIILFVRISLAILFTATLILAGIIAASSHNIPDLSGNSRFLLFLIPITLLMLFLLSFKIKSSNKKTK